MRSTDSSRLDIATLRIVNRWRIVCSKSGWLWRERLVTIASEFSWLALGSGSSSAQSFLKFRSESQIFFKLNNKPLLTIRKRVKWVNGSKDLIWKRQVYIPFHIFFVSLGKSICNKVTNWHWISKVNLLKKARFFNFLALAILIFLDFSLIETKT